MTYTHDILTPAEIVHLWRLSIIDIETSVMYYEDIHVADDMTLYEMTY